MTFTITLYWLKPNSDGTLSKLSEEIITDAENANEAFGKAYRENKKEGYYLFDYKLQ